MHQNLNFRSYENLMESLKLVMYDDIIPEKKKRHFNSDWLLYQHLCFLPKFSRCSSCRKKAPLNYFLYDLNENFFQKLASSIL